MRTKLGFRHPGRKVTSICQRHRVVEHRQRYGVYTDVVCVRTNWLNHFEARSLESKLQFYSYFKLQQ